MNTFSLQQINNYKKNGLLNDIAGQIYSIVDQAGKYSLALRKKVQYKQKIFEEKDDSCKVCDATLLADLEMERFITMKLFKCFPDVPVLSEESQKINMGHQNLGRTFICLDPLDGSYCFANNNDNYSIQLAVIVNGNPILGVSHFPLLNKTYLGGDGIPSHILVEKQKHSINLDTLGKATDFVGFISNASADETEIQKYLQTLGVEKFKRARGCPNLASILEEKCDIYPIFHTNFEWDVAAYDAIIRNAVPAHQNHLFTLDGNPIVYGKSNQREPFKNKPLVATINPLLKQQFSTLERDK